MTNGVVQERREGTPQGGPLSPLLANVLLDTVDRELERRGHRFVRYADDCNVYTHLYVRSRRAGERVMQGLIGLYAKLHLKVNASKSAVAPARDPKFLGYSFWYAAGGVVKRRVSPKALVAMKERVRQITSRNGGRSLTHVVSELGRYLRGWKAYFRLADTPRVFEDVDGWLHRRLRMLILKQWKRGRTTYGELRRRGVSDRLARAAAAHTRRRPLSGFSLVHSRRFGHRSARCSGNILTCLGSGALAATRSIGRHAVPAERACQLSLVCAGYSVAALLVLEGVVGLARPAVTEAPPS